MLSYDIHGDGTKYIEVDELDVMHTVVGKGDRRGSGIHWHQLKCLPELHQSKTKADAMGGHSG